LVFAYHNVGVRCLRVLLDAGVDVKLVITHTDNPAEKIWFDSVARLAAERGLTCVTPSEPNQGDLVAHSRSLAPDFLFSFYYRHMLGAPWLSVPRRGAFNMHGSLLPRYRGRAPVNWAILHGERETGATLHAMEVKPDHGPIIDQCAVPILFDDDARQVFDKVTLAAEIVLARALPRLVAGTANPIPQVHVAGQYFGGRQPEDGRIPPWASARQIHDCVRAVAPPEYPGAFFDAGGRRVLIAKTLPTETDAPEHPAAAPGGGFSMHAAGGHLWIDGTDGRRLRVLQAFVDGQASSAAHFCEVFGQSPVSPDAHPPTFTEASK
jgi:methionyl-tRNA formyltransferase